MKHYKSETKIWNKHHDVLYSISLVALLRRFFILSSFCCFNCIDKNSEASSQFDISTFKEELEILTVSQFFVRYIGFFGSPHKIGERNLTEKSHLFIDEYYRRLEMLVKEHENNQHFIKTIDENIANLSKVTNEEHGITFISSSGDPFAGLITKEDTKVYDDIFSVDPLRYKFANDGRSITNAEFIFNYDAMQIGLSRILMHNPKFTNSDAYKASLPSYERIANFNSLDFEQLKSETKKSVIWR